MASKAKKTTTRKRKHSSKRQSRSFLGRLFVWGFKLTLVALPFVIIYGIYLDYQIRDRIDGKVWDLPAAVYGRMIDLEPGSAYSLKEMTALLRGTQYREVAQIGQAGDFTIKGNTIILQRRAFDFPDAKEGEVLARIAFNGSQIERIENLSTGRDFGYFRLDPKLITMLRSPQGEQRLFVARDGFPETLVNALIATEDRHFYSHYGVNPLSIGRAMLANLQAGKKVQGGSTLTQQLAKNLFLTNERTYSRKIQEVGMALIIDFRYSKERILELYLNEVYFGQSGKGGRGGEEIRGFPLASLYYFGRPIDELTLEQQAMLVGMAKGAGYYNPWRKPDVVKQRRNVVLKLMQQQGYINEAQYQQLSEKPLGLQDAADIIAPQPAFVQLVLNELTEKLGSKMDSLSGVKIFTTLDPIAQDAAEKSIVDGMPVLRKERRVDDLEAAMVVVDRFSGEVRALVGSATPNYPGFNRALNARRPIGSLAKPPVYLAAFSQPERYQLNTWVVDEPISIAVPGGKNWQPNNSDRRFRGQVMAIDALASSLNIPTVKIGLDIGLDSVMETMERLGAPMAQVEKVPAMLLGSTSLTPFEVAQMYQTIANEGHRSTLSAVRSVIAEDNSAIYQSYPSSSVKVAPQAAYLTMYAMQRTVERGTARALNGEFARYHLAAKTGTTNDLRDSWFAGIDGKEVVITWVGRDNNQAANLTGSNGSLKLYRRYLQNQTPVELTLRMTDGINFMPMDQEGFFVCHKTGRELPAWISDPDVFCMMQQRPEVNQPQPQEKENWFSQLFG